jgi:hypothetical protein
MNKAFVREADLTDVLCPQCGAAGLGVMRMTFEAHVPEEARRPLAASAYFCPTPNCPVAYFDAFEATVLSVPAEISRRLGVEASAVFDGSSHRGQT